MQFETMRKLAGVGLAAGLALLLAACILSPGKFTSALDLRKNGSFTYSYKGEIYILGLNQLAEMGKEAATPQEFSPDTCYDDDNGDAERECTEAELAQQRQDWGTRQQAKKDEDEKNSKAFGSLFGGIDPSDPQAAEEIAAKLRRQHGWNAVTYKGNGLYDVDFSVTSTLSHDFTFPVLEGFPMANFFVVANLRDGNVARIEAPGFVVQSNNASSGNGLLQMASVFGGPEGGTDETKNLPLLDGVFTITTDGAILANNTDEGPQAIPTGKQLSWTINKRTTAAPTALIQLGK
ncbi:MAG: hypothetical protein P0Y56_00120 [Candidatus Andeanibacterium colombiense]|uniref:Lipoprotein n=1 Tax=Candidatus Andeanibacterium colombiense TaxID=3121345 RepID=A0AAJ6BP50_9SPHN|nr:MAG: hypothetical protein P0Y56_00120 [Sphingomonadaceae bacterium]